MGLYRGVELDDLILHGPRLDLRPWRPSDALRVHAVMQDEAMHGFLTAVPYPYTERDASAFVGGIAAAARREGTGVEAALVERAGDGADSSGRVVGAVGLSLGAVPEIGYWIAPEAQGHGYAAEAARVLAEWAYGIGVHRIELHCNVGNIASARSALAAGFGFEGISRDGFVPEVPTAATRRGDLARFARLASDSGDPITPVLPAFPVDGLRDGVLGLRPTGPSDATALAEMDDDPESRRWSLFDEDSAAIAAACRRSADRAGLSWLVGPVGRLSMIDLASGAVAGHVLLRISPPQVGLVGYAVHPGFRGRGYTARALRLLTRWAFDVAGLARLELGAKAGNAASQRSALAGGFEPDGVRRGRLRNIDGTFSDEPCFALVNAAAPEKTG